MKNCERCGKVFRNTYDLNRHMSRIKPCKRNIIDTDTQNNIPLLKSPPICAQNNISPLKSPPTCTQINIPKCEYCFQIFDRNSNKTRHLNICKSKEDPIRILEIELNITPEIPENKLECRFCNKVLSRIDTLNKHKCKIKEEYHQKLLKEKEKEKQQVVSNITNNVTNNITNITNNVTNVTNQLTVVLNKEAITQADIECMIKAMEYNIKNFKEKTPDFDDLRMVDLVSRLHRILNTHPENRNIILGSTQYSACKFLTEDGNYINRPTEEVVDEAFRVRSGQLLNMKQSIHEQNPSVLKDRIKRSWDNLEKFEKNGFDGVDNNRRRAKTTFKVAMVN